jgi:hypothetical protein
MEPNPLDLMHRRRSERRTEYWRHVRAAAVGKHARPEDAAATAQALHDAATELGLDAETVAQHVAMIAELHNPATP